ncbi:MAG: hypothetical protein L0323_21255, partial [Planctomycetes bacterium]|nr:hypothetical protein [Planctomycetota bacterium]
MLAARDLRDVFTLPNAWAVVGPTGTCALYVLFRVLLFPNGVGPNGAGGGAERGGGVTRGAGGGGGGGGG